MDDKLGPKWNSEEDWTCATRSTTNDVAFCATEIAQTCCFCQNLWVHTTLLMTTTAEGKDEICSARIRVSLVLLMLQARRIRCLQTDVSLVSSAKFTDAAHASTFSRLSQPFGAMLRHSRDRLLRFFACTSLRLCLTYNWRCRGVILLHLQATIRRSVSSLWVSSSLAGLRFRSLKRGFNFLSAGKCQF